MTAEIERQLAKMQQQGGVTSGQLKAARDRVSLEKSLLLHTQGVIKLEKEQLELIVKMHEKLGMTATISAKTVQHAKEELEIAKEMEKELRKQEMLHKIISKIPIVGRLFDSAAAKKAYDMEVESDRLANRKVDHANALKASLKEGFNVVSVGMGALSLLVEGFNKIKTTVFAIDQGISDLAKGMNVTYKEARAVYEGFVDIGIASGDFSLRASTMAKTLAEVNQSLGSSVYLSEQEVKFMTQLREKAGLASEEIAMINKFTKATGQDQKKFTDDFLKSVKAVGERRGIVINEKQALQDVLKISKDIVASFGMSASKLADAEAAAKKVGISMDKLNSIASTLLDFEQSISAEIEAEILTGKQLNLEMARVYAINNDIAGLAGEIEKNYGSIAEFSQMNRLQQEAAAKAVGLTREELASSLLEAQALAGVSGEDAENRKRALDMLIKQYGVAEAQRILDKEGVDKIMEQYSVQQKFNAAVEKLQELLGSILEGPILGILEGFANFLSNSFALHATLVAIGALMGTLVGAVISMAVAVGAMTGGPLGAFLIGGAILGAISGLIPAVMSLFSGSSTEAPQQVGDMSYDPNGGMVITNPADESMYQLKKSDGMIAGAVSKDRDSRRERGSELKELIAEIRNRNNKNVVLTLDYQRLTGRASTTNYEIGTENEVLT